MVHCTTFIRTSHYYDCVHTLIEFCQQGTINLQEHCHLVEQLDSIMSLGNLNDSSMIQSAMEIDKMSSDSYDANHA